jgi:hypothetical protein
MRQQQICEAEDIEVLARECVRTHSRLFAIAESISFEFEFDGRVLIIRGAVPTYHLKQLIQTALMRLNGVEQLDNQVSVVGRQ